MKIRNSFVSNSSSSSFVIALKTEGECCPFCKRRDFNFIDRVREAGDSESCGDTNLLAVGSEDIMEHCELSERGTDSTQFLLDLKKYEESGFSIAYIEMSYHDEILQNEFDSLKKRGKLIVISDLG